MTLIIKNQPTVQRRNFINCQGKMVRRITKFLFLVLFSSIFFHFLQASTRGGGSIPL
ncbi:hypothetical protein BCV71DRAFT_32286 [Rhizopus microsporus]|uniref:Uncharacterized protein n=1 Tax=Rhizopus microsporus TaxID=58291 RepID=A0A1X0RUG2_RHIZD|nr:hypothetical protein BCV71DRAFT_32286 [Rhizopus microsporus]